MAMETEYKKYKRVQIAEMRPVTENDIKLYNTYNFIPIEPYCKVSILDTDEDNGSPKIGDMIARSPNNHMDQWLVAKQYFEDNFKEL